MAASFATTILTRELGWPVGLRGCLDCEDVFCRGDSCLLWHTYHDMEDWIVYDGDVTIDDFLDKNKPTKINFINMGVFAGDPKQRPREFQYPHAIAEPQKTTLLQEWEQRIKKQWRITRDYVQKLAKKYAYMSGKWIIYCPR